MGIYYAIRHNPSGAFFPLFKKGQRRGSTYLNLPFKGPPRLFTTETGAKNCMRWWLGGEPIPEYDSDDGYSSYQVGASIGKGDPNRKADELEIIKVTISEVA